MSLADMLRPAPSPAAAERIPAQRRASAPPGWEPGVKFEGEKMVVTTTASTTNVAQDEEAWHELVEHLGLTVPPGWRIRLAEARFDPVAWTRDSPEQDKAVTREVWRYRFVVEPAGRHEGDVDLAALHEQARAAVFAPTTVDLASPDRVVLLADFQIGKTGSRGGTAELLERVERVRSALEADLRRARPRRIILADLGDSTEGFQNTPQQARTNDLEQTEQYRIWRRVLWSFVDLCARHALHVDVAAVSSNHTRIRAGKDILGTPADDMGLEALSQVQDMASVNPAVYGHVNFWAPQRHEESLALTLPGGRSIGFVHGHQRALDKMGDWWQGQALGRGPVGECDILVVGHHHQLRVQTVGSNRTLFCCPTMDAGSDWFRALAGHDSDPGVLTFDVDERGWRNLQVF